MNNSQAILDKILGDAQKIAASNIKTANDKAADIIGKAEREAQEIEQKAKNEKKQATVDCLQRRTTVAGIDAKKILLDAKTQVINSVFSATCDKIAALDKKAYLKFIESILCHGAQDGDVVVVSKNDKDRITADFIDGVAKKMKIKLSVKKEYGEFKSGIYIESKAYDKNYTVESEVDEVKDKLIGDLANILFKE